MIFLMQKEKLNKKYPLLSSFY